MFETKNLLIYSVGFDDLRLKRVEILARGNAILQEKYIQKTTETTIHTGICMAN